MTTTAPGCSAFQSRSWSAVIDSDSEQPASGSGIRTVFSGDRIEAVSAMKWTPQKAITSASVARRLAREPERVAHVVGDVLDLGQLVVVGEDDRVALRGQRADLVREPLDLGRRQTRRAGWAGLPGDPASRCSNRPGWPGASILCSPARLTWRPASNQANELTTSLAGAPCPTLRLDARASRGRDHRAPAERVAGGRRGGVGAGAGDGGAEERRPAARARSRAGGSPACGGSARCRWSTSSRRARRDDGAGSASRCPARPPDVGGPPAGVRQARLASRPHARGCWSGSPTAASFACASSAPSSAPGRS